MVISFGADFACLGMGNRAVIRATMARSGKNEDTNKGVMEYKRKRRRGIT